MEEDKKEPKKIIVCIEDFEEGSVIVRNFDDMLHLLDEDWEVKEEYSGDLFIMTKKKTKQEETSKNL